MYPEKLDPSVFSKETQEFYDSLASRIIGQDRAIKAFVRVFQQIQSGLNREDHPAAVFLFLGPTGVGKTALVKEAARHILGSPNAITRIDCGEFQHSHEVSKLIGSPPGYVGYSDGTARLSQENIDRFQTPEHKINFILFDEIEEAHSTVFNAMLQIMDAGRFTLGNGREVDFTKSIVIMTSNLGERETQAALLGKTLGLSSSKLPDHQDEEVYKKSKAAAARHFKAKFMNRIDRLIVFRSLDDASLRKILKNELIKLETRLWTSKWRKTEDKANVEPFRPHFTVTKTAEDFLLAEGTSQIYGARELNRAIERFVSYPLGALVESRQIIHGDLFVINHEKDATELSFIKTGHRDLSPLIAATPSAEIAKLLPTPTTEPEKEVEKSEPKERAKCKHGLRPAECYACATDANAIQKKWSDRVPWRGK